MCRRDCVYAGTERNYLYVILKTTIIGEIWADSRLPFSELFYLRSHSDTAHLDSNPVAFGNESGAINCH